MGTVRSQTEEYSYTAWVPPQDPRLIYRLVGFVEYGMAVQLLDEFVKSSGEEELRIADELVREHPSLAIYTNLSRSLEGPTLLEERPVNARDDFRRHGLPWMLALARVEVGAMLAGFTSHPRPFQVVAPEDYGIEAFRELLIDGLRTHYWSLKRDPVIANYHRTGVPLNHIITYGRRVSVARHFVQAALQLWGEKLLAVQLAELKTQDDEMKRLQLAFLYCLAQRVGVSSSTTVTQVLSACPPLLAMAQQQVGGSGAGAQRVIDGPRFAEILLQIEPRLVAVPCR